jgi:hypothetical protein
MAGKSDLTGAGTCGLIKYHAEADLRRIVNCHCNMCEKMNGSAFSSYAVIPRKLPVISGEDSLGQFQVTESARKHFCRTCGTPLFNTNVKYPGACMIFLGTPEGRASHLPSLNVFSESMLRRVKNMGSITCVELRA